MASTTTIHNFCTTRSTLKKCLDPGSHTQTVTPLHLVTVLDRSALWWLGIIACSYISGSFVAKALGYRSEGLGVRAPAQPNCHWIRPLTLNLKSTNSWHMWKKELWQIKVAITILHSLSQYCSWPCPSLYGHNLHLQFNLKFRLYCPILVQSSIMKWLMFVYSSNYHFKFRSP